MDTKCDIAAKRFTEGFHCSQSVLEAFAADYELDPVLARKIANPLAGGSGLGGECGAVTGALMVLGLLTIQRPFKTLLKKSANLSRNSKPAMAILTVISLSGSTCSAKKA